MNVRIMPAVDPIDRGKVGLVMATHQGMAPLDSYTVEEYVEWVKALVLAPLDNDTIDGFKEAMGEVILFLYNEMDLTPAPIASSFLKAFEDDGESKGTASKT